MGNLELFSKTRSQKENKMIIFDRFSNDSDTWKLPEGTQYLGSKSRVIPVPHPNPSLWYLEPTRNRLFDTWYTTMCFLKWSNKTIAPRVCQPKEPPFLALSSLYYVATSLNLAQGFQTFSHKICLTLIDLDPLPFSAFGLLCLYCLCLFLLFHFWTHFFVKLNFCRIFDFFVFEKKRKRRI